MATYRIAQLNMAYTPQSECVAAFLTEYATDDDATLSLTVSPQTIRAEATYLPTADSDVLEIAAVLRAVAKELPARDRLLLHAATVVLDGRAYAFVAPSGTGKTTHARLWQERFGNRVRILNGDKLIVHLHKNGVTAFGNPWRGKENLGFNGAFPLAGLFILVRGERSQCRPLSPIEALPYLLRATSFETERQTVLSLLERLTAAVPLYHLQATPLIDAVDAAVSSLGGSL